MSAPTDLVTRARSRLATSNLETTSAEAARAVPKEPRSVRDMRREFVSPKVLCPLPRTVSTLVVPYGVC